MLEAIISQAADEPKNRERDWRDGPSACIEPFQSFKGSTPHRHTGKWKSASKNITQADAFAFLSMSCFSNKDVSYMFEFSICSQKSCRKSLGVEGQRSQHLYCTDCYREQNRDDFLCISCINQKKNDGRGRERGGVKDYWKRQNLKEAYKSNVSFGITAYGRPSCEHTVI